ncbi:carbohydrate ABC transporter permease [Niameybacter massiliensis]|uniref:Carbohydrate ABC transporter permease n=1 Tax=Holtiella tumoricola TaxID=3018743 RepID=A0AA42DJA4_9FIRM|nr:MULTISPECIES: carbohydrate ABC transporter permease [Lachnospirales]MDA3729969.1 carbohydrate ABC transporter permease [Holtiella tumoricola]
MNVIQKVKQSINSRKFTRRNRSIGGDLGLMILLGGFALFSAYPLLYAINNAFKPMSEIFLFPPKLFVQNPTLNNFYDLSTIINNSWVPFSRYIFNTLLITLLGTFGTVLLGTMAAYPLAKYKFPGSQVMSNIIVYALMFNASVTAIPNYIIMSKLGMVNTYWAVILPVIGSTLGLYLMKNFIVQIPMALIESAKIDGASEIRVFWTVIIPLCKPAWITLCILSFQTLWGATGGNFIYSENLKPISYSLSQIIGGGIARTGVASVVSLIMMIVPVTVFVISQSNVIETMATSGMKD